MKLCCWGVAKVGVVVVAIGREMPLRCGDAIDGEVETGPGLPAIEGDATKGDWGWEMGGDSRGLLFGGRWKLDCSWAMGDGAG